MLAGCWRVLGVLEGAGGCWRVLEGAGGCWGLLGSAGGAGGCWKSSLCHFPLGEEAQGIMGNVTLNVPQMPQYKASLETAAMAFEFHFKMIIIPIFHSLKAMQGGEGPA